MDGSDLNPPLLWNLEEAARQLGGISTQTVRRLIAQGELATVRVGSRVLIPSRAVTHWIEQQTLALMEAAQAEPKAADYLPDFIRLALHTGMRRGELLGLEWARVDWSQNLIHLAGVNTKSGQRRGIPLNATARAALIQRAGFRATHCPASPWVFCNQEGGRIASIRRSFQTACRRAGLVDFHIHDLRHTCAAWLISAGVAMVEVRDLLGHASITMTERYAHLAPENVRAAVVTLDAASRSGHAAPNSGQEKTALSG